MSLTYTGEDREQIRDILNSIARNYQEQNIERKSAEASKSLAFLAQQLPEVRSRLDVAENKLNAFRQDKDSVDLPLEAKAVLDSMVNIDAQLNELTLKRRKSPSCTPKFTRRTARCWRNVRRWKTKKPNLTVA
ncbi:tyrosine kinase [Escherichia coli]|nr:tyrosine kinase [Escherichia coli]